MAHPVKRQRTEPHNAASTPPPQESGKPQNLSFGIQATIAGFLGVQEILSVRHVCRSLNHNLNCEHVWRQFIQQNFPEVDLTKVSDNKAKFKELHQTVQENIRKGQFSIREFNLDKDRTRVDTSLQSIYLPISTAHTHPVSNCFVTNFEMSKLPDIPFMLDAPFTQCEAYDFSGKLICKPDLSKSPFSSPRTFILSYLTASELFLMAHPAGTKDATCARFSRTDGSFLNSFTFSYAKTAFNTRVVKAIDYLAQQIILQEEHRPQGNRFTVVNFQGKEVQKYTFPKGQLSQFSRATHSVFYLDDTTLCEQPIGRDKKVRFKLPPWTYNPMELHRKPEIEGLEANDQLIAAYSNWGEIRLWDYTTGTLLRAIKPAFERVQPDYLMDGNPISMLSLLRTKVEVTFNMHLLNDKEAERSKLGSNRVVLYDDKGKELLSTLSICNAPLLFPLWERSVLGAQPHQGAPNTLFWSINNASGKSVGTFTLSPLTYGVSCHSARGREITLAYSDRIQILDFGPNLH